MQTNYKYSGEYDTRYIREFLKIYNLKDDNDIDYQYKAILLDNLVVQAENEDIYGMDEDHYKDLINPKYLEHIRQRAQNELNVQQQPQQTEHNF